jgi:hypothetical protein
VKHRISYFDIVGRATTGLKDKAVGEAITRLSATYRAGADAFDYSSAEGRAAYLWHILPAHVCDLARLFADTGILHDRDELQVVGLGSGPGTEVLALLEAISAEKARGGLESFTRLGAVRLEQAGSWDHAFRSLLPPLLEQVGQRAPGLGTQWTVDAPKKGVVCDLTQPPLPKKARAALGDADLVVAANLLTEVRPRGTDSLPPGLEQTTREVLSALKGRTDILLVDRAGAPGAKARMAAFAELAREEFPTAEATGPRERTTRCGCALTRRGKAIYRHVMLPTTKDADRPVKNCKSLWYLLTLDREDAQ